MRAALRTLALAALAGRCPACLREPMFRGCYALRERCAACGVRYERSDGAWLGAAAIGYGFGALFVAALGTVELAAGPLRAAGLDPLWTIALLSLPATALAYRPAKGLWVALLWYAGFVVPDGREEGERPPR